MSVSKDSVFTAFIELLSMSTPEQTIQIETAIRKILGETVGSEPQTKPKKPGPKPKTAAAPTVAVPLVPVPVAVPPTVPSTPTVAVAVPPPRIQAKAINHSRCLARISEKISGWKPAIHREKQCQHLPAAGKLLCGQCFLKLEKYTADPKPNSSWRGQITEEPLNWDHIVGTKWFTENNPKFVGEEAVVPVAPVAPVAPVPVVVAPPPEVPVAPPPTVVAPPAPEKKVKKEKEKEKKEKKAKTTTTTTTPAQPEPVKTVEAVKKNTKPQKSIEMLEIDGEFYTVRGTNVYEYDNENHTIIKYAGQAVDNPDYDEDDCDSSKYLINANEPEVTLEEED